MEHRSHSANGQLGCQIEVERTQLLEKIKLLEEQNKGLEQALQAESLKVSSKASSSTTAALKRENGSSEGRSGSSPDLNLLGRYIRTCVFCSLINPFQSH